MFSSDNVIFLFLDAKDFLLNPQCYVMWQCHVSTPIILKQLFKEQSPFSICRFCYSFRAILYYMLESFPVCLSGFWFRGTTFSYVASIFIIFSLTSLITLPFFPLSSKEYPKSLLCTSHWNVHYVFISFNGPNWFFLKWSSVWVLDTSLILSSQSPVFQFFL